MKRPLYRSLDEPSAFFGIRGRFTTWFGIYLGGALFAALMVGSATSGFFGFLAFFAFGVVGYGFVMSLQSKYSDRQLSMKLASKRYVRFIKVPPFSFRHLWRRDRLDSKW